jgi:hypothetical protein
MKLRRGGCALLPAALTLRLNGVSTVLCFAYASCMVPEGMLRVYAGQDRVYGRGYKTRCSYRIGGRAKQGLWTQRCWGAWAVVVMEANVKGTESESRGTLGRGSIAVLRPCFAIEALASGGLGKRARRGRLTPSSSIPGDSEESRSYDFGLTRRCKPKANTDRSASATSRTHRLGQSGS